MKIIIRIARTELALLFYSPIAWMVLTVFAFQSAHPFLERTQEIISQLKIHAPVTHITQIIFGELFLRMRDNLYFYIPLLTMGLMSRETSSGSIKLLRSSPVTSAEIILGKYLGIVAFGFMLIFSLFLFVLVGRIIIVQADVGQMLSGLFGLYLVMCCYFAIGLLVSCFTSYQVVAAIATFVILAALAYMNSLWQDIPSLRDITYMLWIGSRSDNLINGLVSSKDIFYYLVIIGLALGYAICYLWSRQYKISLVKRVLSYCSFTVLMLMIGWVSSRPAFTVYFDNTATQSNTVPASVREIMESVNESLKMITYVNLMDGSSYMGWPSEKNNNLAFFERYQRFLKHGLDISYVYYYDTCDDLQRRRDDNRGLSDSAIARKIAETNYISFKDVLAPAEIRRQIDLAPEMHRFVRLLEMDSSTCWLRIFNDLGVKPSEYEIGAAVKELAIGPVVIGVATNNMTRRVGDPAKTNYHFAFNELTFRGALVNQGFLCKEFSLDDAQIPKDIAVLMIADPKTTLSSTTIQKIKDYIASGGNLLLVGEPGEQALLNPLLQPLGVQFAQGIVIQGSKQYEPNFILSHVSPGAAGLNSIMRDFQEDELPVTTPTAMAIVNTDATSDFHLQRILETDSSAWIRKGAINMDSGYVSFNAAIGDKKGSYATAVGLDRRVGEKKQRIVVLGDADCISNVEIGRQNFPIKNVDLVQAIFCWLGNDAFPVDARLTPAKDNSLKITRRQMPLLQTIFQFGIPALLLIAAGLLLIYRKNR